MPIRVALDCRMPFGVRTIILNNVRQLTAQGLVRFTLLGHDDQIAQLAQETGSEWIPYDAPLYSPAEQFRFPWRVAQSVDLLHVPHFNVPLFYPGRVVITCNDLIQLSIHSGVRRMLFKFFFRMALHKARAIAAISEYTKHDVCRTFGVAPERITVSPCATSEHFTASSHEGEDQRRVDMLGVPNGYILYLGSIRPHKNLIRLLQAYKRLLAENSNAPSLVITGSRDGFRSRIPEFDALVQDEQLSKKVIYTGFVPEEDKPMLYRGALFYTLPSYHEGFGLMILEAMACGTPVLTSTATSCPEVAGDAALLVDPFSVEALTDGLRRLVTDADYRQELIRRGFERVTHFSWELSAQRIYEVYQQALR